VDDVGSELDRLARRTGFSGAVRVEVNGAVEFAGAYGDANRASGVPNTIETRFAIASGTKAFTALVVFGLVGDGDIELSTPVRSVLGDDLPLIDPGVTVEHLLAHRSGIGDYLDEQTVAVDDYVLRVPAHELDSAESYLAVLDGHPMRFTPGERFAYNNAGYAVLALVAERVAGVAFDELVVERVCRPAGMADTAFLRSDELPSGTAVGYLDADGLRTNVFHLPVRGSGDGGIYSTVGDIAALWTALFAGRIVPLPVVADLLRPRSDVPEQKMRYGLGFWRHPATDAVILEGSDAGVSFRSVHDPLASRTHTVVSNSSSGAWPLCRALASRYDGRKR
jgi:CubicO group peptidase (beta-lactamase class C family)